MSGRSGPFSFNSSRLSTTKNSFCIFDVTRAIRKRILKVIKHSSCYTSPLPFLVSSAFIDCQFMNYDPCVCLASQGLNFKPYRTHLPLKLLWVATESTKMQRDHTGFTLDISEFASTSCWYEFENSLLANRHSDRERWERSLFCQKLRKALPRQVVNYSRAGQLSCMCPKYYSWGITPFHLLDSFSDQLTTFSRFTTMPSWHGVRYL